MIEPAPVLTVTVPTALTWTQHAGGGCRCRIYHPGVGTDACTAAPDQVHQVPGADAPLPVCARCYRLLAVPTTPAADLHRDLQAAISRHGNRFEAAAVELLAAADVLDHRGIRVHLRTDTVDDDGTPVTQVSLHWRGLARSLDDLALDLSQEHLLSLALGLALNEPVYLTEILRELDPPLRHHRHRGHRHRPRDHRADHRHRHHHATDTGRTLLMTDIATVVTDELRAWLLTGADLADNDHHRAGIELLDFLGLLDRAAVRAHIDIDDPNHSDGLEPRTARIDWAGLGAETDLGPLGGAQRRLLALAVSLAGGVPVDLRDALSGELGAAHARAALAAVVRGLGLAGDVQISDTPAYLERKRAHEEWLAAFENGPGSRA
ncbi:hypothetical protein [Nocardia asteroides]